MKAKIRATDELFHKQVEVECSIYKDGNPAQELLKSARSKAIRERIVNELQLSFGEAKLELISYGRVSPRVLSRVTCSAVVATLPLRSVYQE